MSRNHSPNRCEKCQIFRPLCICALTPNLALDTRIVIFMHYREISLTTNTARLACLALPNCEIRVRGQPGVARADGTDLSSDPRFEPYLLYPTDDAEVLTPEFKSRALAAGKKIVLIVPDGNWRQGGKAAKRTPGLERVPAVKLPPGPPSEYRLRKAPRPEYLSTYEAIARSLGILEGQPVHDQLLGYFRTKIDRMLWARGQLATARVHGGIPAAAVEAFSIAGEKGRVGSSLE